MEKHDSPEATRMNSSEVFYPAYIMKMKIDRLPDILKAHRTDNWNVFSIKYNFLIKNMIFTYILRFEALT